MQELAEQSQAGPTTMLRHEIIMLARDLHNEDTTVSRNAALRVKDLVLASNPEQRQNQKLIANVDGLIDGLINLLRRGSLAGKYYSCHALAQLAWSNPSNSLLIPSTPGALDSLALVLGEREPLHDVSAQEYAAITVGNCGANSEEGAKMIVRNQAVMQALVSCMSNAHDVRMQETAVVALKNCAASSQEAALGISQSDQTMALLKSFVLQTTHERLRDVAVGAINSISRSPAAVPKLKTTGVHSAMLQEMLSVEDSRPSGGTSDLRTLTAACAVINIEASQPELHLLQPWLKSAAGKRAIHNMVRCLGFALRGEQWKCVSFSPHSVICPLYNLTRCFALDDLSIDGVKVVQYIVQLIRECQRFSRWKDNLSVSIKILDNLALSAAFQALVRGQCIQLMQSIASTNSTHTSFWFPPHPSPEDQVCIQRIKVQAQKMAKALLALPLAVCMGQHARLGQSSVLLAVDEAILQMVVVYALY